MGYITLSIIVIIMFSTIYLNLSNFPVPTGLYDVGKTEYHLVDRNRSETNNPNMPREIMLHIWYPTEQTTNRVKTAYDTDALRDAQRFFSQRGIPLWLLNGLGSTKTYSQKDAAITSNNDKYSIVIASHGAGPMIQQYTALWEELASHGYVIIGINHTYMAAVTRFPDGCIINSLMSSKKKEGREAAKIWKKQQADVAIKDIKFVLDTLTQPNQESSWQMYNKLDLERIGICGHSWGGSLAMRICSEDNRIKVGIALDATARDQYALTPFTTPFLVLLGGKSHAWQDKEGKQDRENLNILCHLPNMHMTVVTFRSVGHQAFSDFPLLLHSTLITQILSKVFDLDIGASSSRGSHANKIAKFYMVNFLDKYLKNQATSLFINRQCDEYVDIP